jgi:hypothetical protein
MSGQAVRVAWYRFRATFRRRWGGYLALTVLIGLVGGVAMGSMIAARRTYSSYPKFLAGTNPSDLIVQPTTNPGGGPAFAAQLARLPHVRKLEIAESYNAATLTPAGRVGTILITQVELVASADGMFSDLDRVTITDGRAANPARPDEIVASPEAVTLLGLHVGSHLAVGVDGSTQRSITPFAKKLDLTVVGVGVLNIQVVQDAIDQQRTGFLFGTPAMARELDPCCISSPYDGLQLDGGSRAGAVVGQEYEHLLSTSPYATSSHGLLQVYVTSVIEAEAQRAIRPEATALGVFGLIAGLAALIIGTQSIARQLRASAGEADVLHALGAGPAATFADGLLGILGAVIAGSLLAAAVAAGLSPLTLFGPVRTVEPSPGIDLDPAVLGLGALALVTVLGAVAAVLAYRQAPHRRADRTAGGRGSGVLRAALAAGLPAAGVAGIRFALEPGRGRTAVPVRSVVAGAVLAFVVGIATLTFGASLSNLISHPALYGWNFSYALYSVDGYGPLPPQFTGPLLARDRSVAATTGVYFLTIQVDGQTVPAILSSAHPAVGPQPLQGTGLESDRQIVLGPDTMAQLHKQVGDFVWVSEGGIVPRVRLQIAGTATLPTIGTVLGIHASMSTGAIVSTAVVPAPVRIAQFGALSGPNAIFVRLRPGVSEAAGLRGLQRITARLNAEGHTPQALAALGSGAQYIDAVSLLPVQRPAEIVNYRSMGTMPAALAGGLAAGTLAALALTLTASVRRRRRDLALLKTLGFTRRQLAGAVAWQSSAIAVIGLLIGIPAGIAFGRLLWLGFARQLSAVPDPVVPATSIALAALAALILANLVAALPGRRAARTPAALLLRAE